VAIVAGPAISTTISNTAGRQFRRELEIFTMQTNKTPKTPNSDTVPTLIGAAIVFGIASWIWWGVYSWLFVPIPPTPAELVQQERQRVLSDAKRQCREALEPALARALGLSPSSIAVFTDFASEVTTPFGSDVVPVSFSASGQMQIRLPFEGHAGFTCDFEGGRVTRAQFYDIFSKGGLLLKEIVPETGNATPEKRKHR
jgi:hypothetical protein